MHAEKAYGEHAYVDLVNLVLGLECSRILLGLQLQLARVAPEWP